MPQNTYFRLPPYFVLSFSALAALKICLVFYTLWAIVPEKYIVFVNLIYLPVRYWHITVPFLVTSLAFFHFVYDGEDGFVNLLSPDSATGQSVYNSRLLMIPNQNNECICVNKNLCYKEYYDDVYIECVSKSSQH